MQWESNWNKNLIQNLSKNEMVTGFANADLRTLINIELGLMLLEKLRETDPRGLWVVISGYTDFSQRYGLDQLHSIANARILLSHFASMKKWIDALEEYQSWNEKYPQMCLYEISMENTEFQLNATQCIMHRDRIEIYHNTLEMTIGMLKRKYDCATNGDYKNGDITIHIPDLPYSQIIPKAKVDNSLFPLETPVSHLPLQISMSELINTAKEMDSICPDMSYYDRLCRIDLKDGKNLSQSVSEIQIKDIVHLVGVVNSGKSTLIDIIGFYCHRHNLHIGIVVEDVVRILEKVSLYEKFGIKTVPVIGKANRKKHRNGFELSQINQCGNKEYFPFSTDIRYNYLSPICCLRPYTSSFKIKEGKEPCFKLYNSTDNKDKTVYYCPFFPICPKYHAERELFSQDSNIWLLTTDSLIYSKLSPLADPYERTYLEIVQWALDVLIIDEVDQSQIRFDTVFSSEKTLTGYSDFYSLDKISKLVQENIVKNNRKNLRGKAQQWQQGLSDAMMYVNILICCINEWPESYLVKGIQHHYINPVLSFFDLQERIMKKIAPNDDSIPILEYIETYIEGNLRKYLLIQEIDGVLDDISRNFDKDVTKVINKCRSCRLTDLLKEIPLKYQKEIIFFLILVKLDNLLAQVFNTWDPTIFENLDLGVDLTQYFLQINPLYHVLFPHSAIGRYFGYIVPKENGETSGTLKIMSLANLGRGAIYRINTLFEGLFFQKGPNVVLMSATSWIPGSPHYHLEIPPDYVIQPREDFLKAMTESQCKIYLFTSNEKRIRVSGISDPDKKAKNLQQIIRNLVQKDVSSIPPFSLIEQIISTLPEHRQKALFIVNSYEQVDIVWDEIRRVNPELAQKAMKLTRDLNNYDSDELTINRTELPRFGLENAQILIIPLQTIERGYNILNTEDKAAFGSIHFLIRPMPHPEDFMINIHKLNGWACEYLSQLDNTASLHDFGIKFRGKANHYWADLFKEMKYYKQLSDVARNSLLTDTFALLLQLIGRTIRGNVPTQVYFHDGAFFPERTDTEYESLFLGLVGLSETLFTNVEYGPLLRLLYEPFIDLFQRYTEI